MSNLLTCTNRQDLIVGSRICSSFESFWGSRHGDVWLSCVWMNLLFRVEKMGKFMLIISSAMEEESRDGWGELMECGCWWNVSDEERSARQGKSIFFFYHKEGARERNWNFGWNIREGACFPSLGNRIVLYCIGIACIASALPLPLPARYPAVTLRLGLCKLINGTYLLHMPTPRFNLRGSNGCVLKVLLNLVILMLTASGVQG